jgi:hypothetical protein
VSWVVWGTIVGVLFAMTVLAMECKHTLRELSKWRMAAWGALAASGLPVIAIAADSTSGSISTLRGLVIAAIAGCFGAFCAAFMLRLAQREKPA